MARKSDVKVGTKTAGAYLRSYLLSVQDLPLARLHPDWAVIAAACFFGCGAAVYFALEIEPPLTILFLCAGITTAIAILSRTKIRTVAIGTLLLLLGCLGASLESRLFGVPASVTSPQTVQLTGRLLDIERFPDRPWRLTVRIGTADRPDLTGRAVRLNDRTTGRDGLAIGMQLTLRARLMPPPGPAVPGGFNYARKAYFDGLSAVGFVLAHLNTDDGVENASHPQDTVLSDLRDRIAARMRAVMPGQAGALAAAFMVGRRDGLSTDSVEAMRSAGLAHLLAISGLHMGLIVGLAFFLAEWLIAVMPVIRDRVIPRRTAAIAAWGVGFAYLLLSGFSVATVRAFLMVSIALLAVLLERRVLSMRSVALAALTILLLSPSSIVSVSFQMSFAATAALVLVYERARHRLGGADGSSPHTENRATGWLRKGARFFLLSLLTTLIAQVAITPVALYHFQSVSLIALAANLTVMPLMVFWVMPMTLMTLACDLFGLAGLVAPLFKPGLEQILSLAEFWAGKPGSVFFSGAISVSFLCFSMAALAWAALWHCPRTGLAGAIPLFLAGFFTVAFDSKADLILSGRSPRIAMPGLAENRLMMTGRLIDGFRQDVWRRYWGLDGTATLMPVPEDCGPDGCMITVAMGKGRVSLPKTLAAVREDCRQPVLVVLPRLWRRYCHGPAIWITREDIDRYGPVAVTFADAPPGLPLRIAYSRPKQPRRPWHAGWAVPEMSIQK